MDPAKMAQLKELASMKDSGVLTEAEFATQKAALLAVAPQAQPRVRVRAVISKSSEDGRAEMRRRREIVRVRV